MNRKPVQEWMLLFTYIFVLILVTIHSGFLCRKFFFILKQFMPVAAAGVLAFVLNHPYKFVESLYEKRLKFSKRIARIGALLTIYLGLIGMIGVLGRIALPRFISGLQNFIEKRDSYIASFESSAVAAADKLGIGELDLSPIIEGVTRYLGRLDKLLEEILPQMARMTTGVIRLLAMNGIILVLSMYILYDKKRLKYQMTRLFNTFVPRKFLPIGRKAVKTTLKVFDNFVVGQGIESMILGSLCLVGMLILRLEYSGFVSLVVGMTAFIPFFGAYIGCGLGTILLLFISIKKAITFFIFFIVLQQLENNFIYPRVVGKRTGLPAFWVIVSVTVGGGLLGVVGMILSVPIVTLLYKYAAWIVARKEETNFKRQCQEEEKKGEF